MKNRPAEKIHHLETGILGSAFGDGRFLKTKDLPANSKFSPRTEDVMGMETCDSTRPADINGTDDRES